MIHKTVLRLSAFISRNASCWHHCAVITLAAQRKRAGDRGCSGYCQRFTYIYTLSNSGAWEGERRARAAKLMRGEQVSPFLFFIVH